MFLPELESADNREPLIVLGKDVNTQKPVSYPLTVEGNPNIAVVGLSGYGKTNCLSVIADRAYDHGVLPICISSGQDMDNQLKSKFKDVRFIDPYSLGYNPLQVIDRQSPRAYLDVAGNFRDSLRAIYPSLGDLQLKLFRDAVINSYKEKGWADPNADLTKLEEPEFKRVFELLKINGKRNHIVQKLLVRLEELNDYGLFDVKKTSLSLLDSTLPVVIRLHVTQNECLRKALLYIVLNGLFNDMCRRGRQGKINHIILIDEVHRVAGMQLIVNIAREGRKFGCALAVASQSAKDFDASNASNASLLSLIPNYLVLKLNNKDASVLVRNVTTKGEQQKLIDKIMNLKKYQAMLCVDGDWSSSPTALHSIEIKADESQLKFGWM